MITGDHKDTALAIGLELGLVDVKHSDAVTGPELDAMTENELMAAVQNYNVFARASPQNKISIVKALQAQNEVCGMTGKFIGMLICLFDSYFLEINKRLISSLRNFTCQSYVKVMVSMMPRH
jgi:translation elongation factor EF-Tu-like GTPase